MTTYGVLLRLYPRAFREEYGEDMTQLLRDQLRDESATRVWARTVLDVALTCPTIRLEAHMSHALSARVVYGSATVACLVVAAVVGSSAGVSIIGLAGVLIFGTLTFISWRRARTLGPSAHAVAHWWKYLAAGVTGLAGVVGWGTSVEELPDGAWFAFMGCLVFSVVLIAVGLVLGITNLLSGRRAGTPLTGS